MPVGILRAGKYSSNVPLPMQPVVNAEPAVSRTVLLTTESSTTEDEGYEESDCGPLNFLKSPAFKAAGLLGLSMYIAPMLYLLAHEGGHCGMFRLLKPGYRSVLYLGCDAETDRIKFFPGTYVVVCPAYFTSFVAQSGYCEYDDVSFSDFELAALCISGSLAGGWFMYFCLLVTCQALYPPVRKLTNWKYFTSPFWLFQLMSEAPAYHRPTPLVYFTLVFCITIGYVVNVNRIFYALVPTTPDGITVALTVDELGGDGFDLWDGLGISSGRGMLRWAIVGWIAQWGCFIWIGYRAIVCYKNRNGLASGAGGRDSRGGDNLSVNSIL
jgi:hypothetical protein